MFLRARLAGLVLFLLGSVSLRAISQQGSAPGAAVHGIVVDPDDALIPGASVTLRSASGEPQITSSKSDGTYAFRGLAGGTYGLTVSAPGFALYAKQGLLVTAGASLDQDAKMSLQKEIQQINVTTDTVQLNVDPENNASSTVITGTALDALSDDPDELQTELTALAGPSAGPNGGQIYIDGFTGGQLPPKSSILSIRINQNPFSAQYDQPGYGRIEIITKPGTDGLRGNVSTQFGDKFLNTSTPFLGAANSQPDYHTLFFMGNVTGPVRQGMSFALSGSHRNIDDNSIVNPTAFYASSPSSTQLCAPGDLTCSSYPFPTTARALANPQTRWDISPRIDMLLGQRNTLTVRYQYETGSSSMRPAVLSPLLITGSNSANSDSTIQVSETQLISSRIIDETRFEYQHSTSNLTPLSSSPSLSVQGVFTAGGSNDGTNSTSDDHVEFQNYASLQMEKNFVRFGGRLRTSGQSSYSNEGTNGSFIYSYLLDPCTDPAIATKPSNCRSGATAPCAAANTTNNPASTPNLENVSSYQCGITSQFLLTNNVHPTTSARETDLGLYVEDDWKAKPNLTISYGLRLEAQNVISSAHDFGPRTSIAYGIPRKSGKTITVLRGGFGIFYNRFSLSNIASQLMNNGVNTQDFTYTSPGASCQPSADLSGYNPACTQSSATPAKLTAQVNSPGLRSAYILESVATLEQQVGRHASVSVTYLNAHGEHQFLQRVFPVASSAGTVYEQYNQSGGVFRQNQINTNINVRTPAGTSVFGYYSANWANSNISNITDPYNSAVDYGRAGFAVRSRMVLGGSVPLPYHFTASPLIFAQSGSPYNVTTGTPDSMTLQFTDRPAFAPGVTAATASCINAQSFSKSTLYVAGGANLQIPVNNCTGPVNVSINLRLARTFGFGTKTAASAARVQSSNPPGGPGGGGPPSGGGGAGRGGGGGAGGPGGPGGGGGSDTGRKYSVTIGAQAMNLFNQVAYSAPVSILTSADFGKVTSIAGGPFSSQNAVRRITLQANFNF